MKNVDTSVKIGALTMKNPVTTGSGTFGSGLQMTDYVDLTRLGAITIKGTTLEPREGVLPPRTVEERAGINCSVGLQNPGVDVIIRDVLPEVAKFGTPIIANVGGGSPEEYAEVVRRLNAVECVSAIELNLSCPNLKKGGLSFGTDPEVFGEVIAAARDKTDKPLIVKLTPAVSDVALMARVARDKGADGLTLSNGYPSISIDLKTRRPALGNVQGGLCGPALKPINMRLVWQASQAVDLPIIALGGIICWQDAIEYILAGATGVSVGVGNFLDPSCTMHIVDGIEQYLANNGFDSISELIGYAWKHR